MHDHVKKHTLLSKKGFTIVELAVVIGVIGILAALTAAGWNGWRTGLAQKSVKSDLTAAGVAMENAKNFGAGYPVSIPSTYKAGKDVTVTYVSGDAQSYCIQGVSKIIPSVGFFINTANGTDPVAGTCAGGANTSPAQTILAYDTTKAGCSGTVQLPVTSPAVAIGSTIDWGDGLTGTLLSAVPSHTYSTPGQYIVKYDGPITTFNTGSVASANRPCLTELKQWGSSVVPTKISFQLSTNLTSVDRPPSSVTDMSYMFDSATAFNQPLSTWDTSNVTNMSYMFDSATAFNQPLNTWDTSNVTNMSNMFAFASAFNQPLSSWDTSNVTNMSSMFLVASAFNQPLNTWNTSKVTNLFAMFQQTPFNQSLSSWDTSNVTNMAQVFYFAQSFNQPLNSWNTSKATTMRSLFGGASAFNQPLSSWNTSAVTTMDYMFYNASVFNQDLSSWNVAAVTPKPPTSFRSGASAWTLPKPGTGW